MSGLRISGGSLRGRKLRVDAKSGVRPTSERARQAFFNIVADLVPDARFLDLFAGSGIFSFEAVSRGAKEAIAIDSSRKNVASIEKAANEWDVPVHAEAARLPGALARLATTPAFDLVYVDPPYNMVDYAELLTEVATLPLNQDAIVAVEHKSSSRPALPDSAGRLRFTRTSKYGNVSISFFDLNGPNEHQ